jgi:hypothetical protein
MNIHAPTRTLAAWIALATLTATASAPAEAGKPPSKVPRGRDTTPPTIVCPADITVEAQYSYGMQVGFQVSVTDDADPAPTFSINPYPNSWFPIGTTLVTVTATDWRGNTATSTFHVSVVDTTPPTLVCPGNITAEATGASGAAVWFWASATDRVDYYPTIASSSAPGSTFPIGTTAVTVTATDSSGNSATCNFDVTVRDTTPPAITCPNVIFRAVTGPETVTFTVTAADLVDPSPTVSVSPESGSLFPIGSTTVTVTATDATGNSATRTFEVSLDDDPTDGPFAGTYAFSWVGYDAWGEPRTYYEWSVTISPDGTVSGSGQQTALQVDWYYCDEYWCYYAGSYFDDLWDLEAFGSLSGHVTDAGSLEASGPYDFWINDQFYGQYVNTYGLSFAAQASLDADGNLVLIDQWGNSTTWLKQ